MKQLWLACGLFACGNVTTKSPDAGGGSADTTPPMLVSSTPAADATDVALMKPLQLVFDESLDPASVTSDVFALGCWECQPVFTTPTYDDATHTVTLAPLIPLDPDVSYILMIGSGLRDVAGNAFAGEDVVFHTRKNSATRLVNYAGNGTPSSWSAYTLDAAGNIAALTSYSGPGPDAVWLTPDDVISEHLTWARSGPMTVRTTYGAGTDGKFGTADDVVSGTFETDNNSDGNPITYWTRDGSGAVTQMETQSWDGRWITETDTHSGAGADGQWNTADDPISRVMKYQYDARHRMVRQIEIDRAPTMSRTPPTT